MHLLRLGVAAHALEAADLLNYAHPILTGESQLVFVSQSGSSGEIAPITSALPDGAVLLAVTNDPQSLLARRAHAVLPLFAGEEDTVATKTYLNSLATLWLLARHWGGILDGSEGEQLTRVADDCAELLDHAHESLEQWLDTLSACKTLLFVGHGPHAATAQQAAQTVSEWAKVPAHGNSIGAYRHGRIEAAGPELGAVIFAGRGPARVSAVALAAELRAYGASVLLIEDGRVLGESDSRAPASPVDEFLMPILDIIPVQLFAEGLARHLGVAPGFQHIAKVVTRL